MALPLLGGLTAAVVAGISGFVASRAGWLLAGLGVGFATMKGAQLLLGYIVADLNAVIGAMGGSGGSLAGLSHIGWMMMKLAAYSGLFDALNIVIGGYMATYGLISMRVILRRLTG